MPHWEGIEDTSAQPASVWLSRRLAEDPQQPHRDEWTPLRKADCQALNQAALQNQEEVHIECGRSTANLAQNIIRYNFFRGEERELCSAVWFVREDKGSNVTVLHPVQNDEDEAKMETLYQKAVQATSSLGKGIASVLEERVELEDGGSKIQVHKAGDTLTLRQIPSGWFKNTQVLQRGYGAYQVEGEEVELALGPVRHLIFIVHGIGEALFSREDVKVAGLVEQTHAARRALQQKQYTEWQRQCDRAARKHGKGADLPPPPNRIELIPIEWFSRMHDSSSALMRSLKATTLNTIPALRAIANDVVFDVLM